MKESIIRLGLECNMDCLFCTIADDNSKKMSLLEIKNKILELKKKGAESIILTGGEPTLRTDLNEIIFFAKSEGIKLIDLQSNAILFSNEKYLMDLKQAGLNFVTVGFPSHKKEKYNYLTKSNFYEKALVGINNLVKHNIDFGVYHVINSENYKDLIEFTEFINSLSSKIRLAFAYLRPNGNTLKNKQLVLKLSDLELNIHNLFSHLKKKRIEAYIEGVPLCYLCGFENKSIETKRLKTSTPYVSEDELKHESLYADINLHLKIKSKKCEFCKLNELCVGVWKEYADIHGNLELYPVFINSVELGVENV